MASLRDVYKVVIKYIDHNKQVFSVEQMDAAAELKRRLLSLENSFNRLTHINEELSTDAMPEMLFDPETGVMTQKFMGIEHSIKVERANPLVPVSILLEPVLLKSTYINELSDNEIESEVSERLKIEMEPLIEQYYYNAFRVSKLIQILTGKSRYDCRVITIVRNNLIEHPKSETIYSFGFGLGGPFIKPVQRGVILWEDSGLVKNTEEFVSSLSKVFA